MVKIQTACDTVEIPQSRIWKKVPIIIGGRNQDDFQAFLPKQGSIRVLQINRPKLSLAKWI